MRLEVPVQLDLRDVPRVAQPRQRNLQQGVQLGTSAGFHPVWSCLFIVCGMKFFSNNKNTTEQQDGALSHQELSHQRLGRVPKL